MWLSLLFITTTITSSLISCYVVNNVILILSLIINYIVTFLFIYEHTPVCSFEFVIRLMLLLNNITINITY